MNSGYLATKHEYISHYHEIDQYFFHSENSITHPEWNETGAVSYYLASLGGSSKGAPGCGANMS